jgi:1-acyl-sn-glycerol-3-phosphate acyltransferase
MIDETEIMDTLQDNNELTETKRDRFISAVFFPLAKYVFAPIIRLIWIKKVVGLNHIPLEGPAILTFNHASYFDFIAFLAVSPRHVHFLAAEKFYDSPFWRPLMEVTQQIRVYRTKKDKRDLFDEVHRQLSNGHVVGIFPEGTRAPSERLLPAYGGVVKFAARTGVHVIPVGIKGTFEVLSRHNKIPRLKKTIEIIVDEPIEFPSQDAFTFNKRCLQVFADGIMRRIASLVGKEYNYKTYMRKHMQKKVAVFDVDGTLIKGQVQRYLLSYLYKNGFITPFYFYKILMWFVLFKLGIVNDPKKIMQSAYLFLKGKDVKSIDAILKTFVEHDLQKYFYEKGKRLVAEHKKSRREIFFISNMPSPLLKYIAEQYGVDHYQGTRLEVDSNNRYTGKVTGNIVFGIDKIEALYTLLESGNYTLKKSFGYADHISDIPLLTVLDHRVVVNPTTKMHNYAEKKRWHVMIMK